MPVSGARAAIKAVLAGYTAYPIVYENERYTPPTESGPWVEVEIYGGDYTQESIGSTPRTDNYWQERGGVFCNIFVPSGSGTSTSDTIMAALAELFRGQTLTGGYEIQDMSTGPGSTADEAGLWYRTTLTIEWVKR